MKICAPTQGQPSNLDPDRALVAGAAILSTLLQCHSFVLESSGSGHGSGGKFAWAAYVRGNRKLELHFRYSLGMVVYHLGDRSISHGAYMWSVLGKPHASQYPGFSDDPLDGFRHLRADIEECGADFLSGTDAEFLRHFDRAAQLEKTRPKLPL